MNRTLAMFVPLCLFLAACSSTPQSAVSIPNCAPGPVANACPPGLEDRNRVTIKVTPGNVMVTPPVVCAARGTTIVATIEVADGVPDKDEVVVATVPKNAANGWILSQGTGDGNTFDIKVPDPKSIEKDFYGYFAMASTGQCQDPEIHVDQ